MRSAMFVLTSLWQKRWQKIAGEVSWHWCAESACSVDVALGDAHPHGILGAFAHALQGRFADNRYRISPVPGVHKAIRSFGRSRHSCHQSWSNNGQQHNGDMGISNFAVIIELITGTVSILLRSSWWAWSSTMWCRCLSINAISEYDR